MKKILRQRGVTLTEMIVVVACVAILASLGIPTVRVFQRSIESPGAAKSMISGALASARAIAAKEQHYAGIRFQEDLNGHQYMIFIINDPELKTSQGYSASNGFRAVKGLKPIKLPESLGVMALPAAPADMSDAYLSNDDQITDATTFSIVFAPSGRLMIHVLYVIKSRINDDVFNDNGLSMFYQDDDGGGGAPAGLQEEDSRNGFVIYERKQFMQAYGAGQPWTGYLVGSDMTYINPYTGTMILRD